MNNLEEIKERISQLRAKKFLLQEKRKGVETRLIELRSSLQGTEEFQVYVQTLIKNIQSQLKYKMEEIVQYGLDLCFPGLYKFSMEFVSKRGQSEINLSFKKKEEEIDPVEDSGIGMADIASFSLRMGSWSINPKDNTIVMDEPFKHLSTDLQPLAAELIKVISKELGIQFILITHMETLTKAADKLFRVTINNEGISTVTEEEIPA